MDAQKIAIITCVNDVFEYKEALYYIEQLELPDGFSKDIIAIQDAESMASGYQAAMKSSDAKYKIYMHQDVFINNKNCMKEIVEIFQKNTLIGMIGLIGRKELPEELTVAADWDVGNINFNGGSIRNEIELMKQPLTVDAVDGLFIATQYDVDWREDIFDGWDFYDISQCQEFKRKGYAVVVPFQGEAWCYHDNLYSRLGKYFYYQQIFCDEYQDIKKYKNLVITEEYNELDSLVQEMKNQMEVMVNHVARQELKSVFWQMNGRVHLGLEEFHILLKIDTLEECNLQRHILWKDGENWNTLREKMRMIKFSLKRMEYDMDLDMHLTELYRNYSIYAIMQILMEYTSNHLKCMENMKRWHIKHDRLEEWTSWENAIKIESVCNQRQII